MWTPIKITETRVGDRIRFWHDSSPTVLTGRILEIDMAVDREFEPDSVGIKYEDDSGHVDVVAVPLDGVADRWEA